MANYVLMYHGGATPEEPVDAVMARWMARFGEMGEAVVDMGSQVRPVAVVASDGSSSGGTDGEDDISGYTVISVDSVDKAIALAKGCPGRAAGGSLSIYESMRQG